MGTDLLAAPAAADPDPVAANGGVFLNAYASTDELASKLEALANFRGDRALLRAARSLRQMPPGAPKKSDELLLCKVRAMLTENPHLSLTRACKRVAIAHGKPDSGSKPESIAHRLRRKFKASIDYGSTVRGQRFWTE